MAILIELELALQDLVVRNVTNKDEDTVRRQRAFFTRDRVLDLDAGYLAGGVANDFCHHFVPDKFHFLVGKGAILQDLAGAQCIAAVKNPHLGRKLGQEKPFFDSTVTTTDHDNVLAAEEETVASATIADAFPRVLFFTGNAEKTRSCPRGEDDRLGGIFFAIGRAYQERMLVRHDFGNIVKFDARAEFLRLLFHLLD